MIRIVYFSFFMLLFAACVKDNAGFSTGLSIDQRAVTLNASADTTKITVYSNGNWTMENRDEASWITIQKASGKGMEYAIVSVTDNSAGLPRAATLVVRSGSQSDTIRLGQRGIVPQITITSTAVSIPAPGGTTQTAIETNLPLSYMNVTYTYANGSNWISNLQIVNKNLRFDAEANSTAAARSAKIYLSYLDAVGTTTKDSLTVNQAKP